MGFAFALFVISCITWITFWVLLIRYKDAYEWEAAEKKACKQKSAVSFIISLILTIIWVIIWWPFFQPIIFNVFYLGTGFWIVAALILVIAIFAGLPFNQKYQWNIAGIAFAVGFCIWLIIFMSFSGGWMGEKIYNSVTYEETSNMPDTTAVRYLPMEVAWRYGENRLQEPMVSHSDADPVVIGDEMRWVLTRVPKGFWNSLLRNADGFTVVDSQGNISTIRQKMTFGEGMLGADNILWQLREHNYWVEIPEIYYLQSESKEVVAVAPYLKYSFRFPVMVPYLGGVFLVHSNGAIEDLSPSEAMQNTLLKGTRIFPEKLSLLYAKDYAYKNGIANTIFKHRDQIKIPSVGTNQMPFLMPTEKGQKWVVAATPWGAEGIYRIFFIDAITGEVELLTMSGDSTLIGPNRARDYIVNAYPTFKWDQITALEPRPIMKQENLYWMFTITPNTFAGVVDTVLVDSKTNEVISLGSNYQTTLDFLNGKNAGRVVTIGDNAAIDSTEQIINESGGQLSREDVRRTIEDLKKIIRRLEELENSLPENK